MSVQETILQLGCEGASATIYRIPDPQGQPAFQIEAVNLTLDENDEEVWKTVTSKPYPSFDAAMKSIGPQGEWMGLLPLWIHPEFKEVMATMVQAVPIQPGDPKTDRWAPRRDRWLRWLKTQ